MSTDRNNQISGITSVSSGPLILRTYNNQSGNNTYLVTNYEYPVSSNYVLITSSGGQLAPSNNFYVSSISASTMNMETSICSTILAQHGIISSLSTLHVEGSITTTGGITNLGYTPLSNTDYLINWGFFSFPSNSSTYFILSGTGKSSDTSYVYVTFPEACSPMIITGYNLYGGYNATMPGVHEVYYVSGNSGPATGVSFNWGGSELGNDTNYIQFTIYGYK
jgi:hypothetical protein